MPIKLEMFQDHDIGVLQGRVNGWISQQPKGTVIKHTEMSASQLVNDPAITICIWYHMEEVKP